MGCAGCTVCNTSDGEVKGCKSNGSCATGYVIDSILMIGCLLWMFAMLIRSI